MRQLNVYVLLFVLLLLSAKVKAQQVTIVTKWTAQAQFAGYYVADKLGFYADEGIEVSVQHPALSENSFSFIDKENAKAIVMNLSYAIIEEMAGTRLVNIMQTSQESSLMIVSRFPLKGMEDLRNQKIAVWNHLNEKLLNQLAGRYDLQEVEWIRFNGGVDIFLSGAVDYCLVGSYNEYLQLKEYGRNIEPSHLLRLADYGYQLSEDGLYVTEEYYNKYPEVVSKIVNASIRGWEWTVEHPEEALDIVMEKVKLDNIGTNRYHQRKMLEEVLRLQVDRESGQRTYRLSRNGFERAIQVLIPQGVSISCLNYENFVKQE